MREMEAKACEHARERDVACAGGANNWANTALTWPSAEWCAPFFAFS